MSGQQLLVTVTGSTVLLAALVAAALIWLVVTDPVHVAALAATGDVLALLRTIAGRLLAWLW